MVRCIPLPPVRQARAKKNPPIGGAVGGFLGLVLNTLNQVLSAQTPPRQQPGFRVVRFVAVPVIELRVSRRMRDSIRARR